MISLIPLKKIGVSFTLLKKKQGIVASITSTIMASYDYVYDPEHKKKPSGGYHPTEQGWSNAEQSKSEITISPDVNIPVKDEYWTKFNEKNFSDLVTTAISQIGGKDVSFGISQRKAGRYLEDGVLYEESSFSINLRGATPDIATKIGEHLASVMKQSSVLIWDEENKSSRIVHNLSNKKDNFTFQNESIKFFLDSGNTKEVIKKIDDSIRSVAGNKTGWTISPVESKKVHKIGEDDYFPATNSLIVHGITSEHMEKIAKVLFDNFNLPVLVRDMVKNTENIYTK